MIINKIISFRKMIFFFKKNIIVVFQVSNLEKQMYRQKCCSNINKKEMYDNTPLQFFQSKKTLF